MDGFAVTPEQLAEAAAMITGALGDRAVACPPSLTAWSACGHGELAAAVAEFSSAVQLAATVLVARAEEASVGLCEGAQAYGSQERRNAVAVTEVAVPDARSAPRGGGG